MKRKLKSFGVKLWLWFGLFAAIIFAALWLLQTVFLQYFYNGMVMKNVAQVSEQIAARLDSSDLKEELDNLAYENALLIFLTDESGKILYNTDEHSHVYENSRNGNSGQDSGQLRGWQIGAMRNVSLPKDYDVFLQRLLESGDGTTGYQTEDNSAYVYGAVFTGTTGNVFLYISTSLGAVGATVSILRTQLIWVTAAALLLALAIAFLIAGRFSRPVTIISGQAGRMAAGDFEVSFEKGFCSELDELADTLSRTAGELSKTERYRREFLANVSHDLRTPLTMIRGYAEMIRDISWDDETQRETDLSVIMREADRLTELVNEILEYTSLQSGVQQMEREHVDISAVTATVLEQFEPLCTHNGYCINAQIPPHLMVSGDRQQLSRVLYNLIDNAVSHAGEKKTVQILLESTGKTVRVAVRDYGEGIPEEELPYIWERYFTKSQRKRNQKGSGLGLSICREILLAHKAQFGVESAAGEGSTFWFELDCEPG